MRFSTLLGGAVLGSAAAVSAMSQITIKDRHFYNSTSGAPFFVRGVDYQPGGSSAFKHGSDPLTDTDALARDIYLFQKLGINTIRVYSVDPSVDHDVGMTMLATAGIYLILDLNTPIEGEHLNALQPWTTYNKGYLNHLFQVLEVFKGYDNLLGVLAGNEVVFEDGSAQWAPQYVKAVVRDVKNYMQKNMNRQIPVGYANADVLDYRVSMADYLQCGNENDFVDFFGVNSYQWCGPDSTFTSSGYDILTEQFSNYSIPAIFTEFGCIKPPNRAFNEVTSMYSSNMTGIFAGGLVYQYTQDTNMYGLVTVDGSGSATILSDYDRLQAKYAAAVNPTIPADATTNVRPTACTGPFPNINGTTALPTSQAQDLIDSGIDNSTYKVGSFVALSQIKTQTTYKITNSKGVVVSSPAINEVDPAVNSQNDTGKPKTKSAAPSVVAGSSLLWSMGLVGFVVVLFL